MSASLARGLAITNPLVKYRALVATKQITQDPAQVRLALHLQKLYDDLKDYEPQIEYSARINQIAKTIGHESKQDAPMAKPSAWRALLAAKEQRDSLALTRTLTSHQSAMELTSPKGLMLHGEVGTGKSMLIDLFADCLPTKKKRRWHFNTFMLETLAKLESLRKSRLHGGTSMNAENDPALLWLAKDMIQESPILFLDEFQMPDRAASKILTNLMTSFFQLGGVLIATSNRMPEELAKAAGLDFPAPKSEVGGWSLRPRQRSRSDGLFSGRNEFVAFLDVLKARCDVWEMDGGKDYRRLESGSIAPVRDHPEHAGERDQVEVMEDDQADQQPVQLPRNFQIMTSMTSPGEETDRLLATNIDNEDLPSPIPWSSATVSVYGRTIAVPQTYSGISKWTFQQLCHANLGPADYITLASTFHTLIVTDIPVLTWLMKNEARRFITLLDALYESRCKLLVSAAAGPDDLFFPEKQNPTSDGQDAVYSETLSDIYQDATAPFRPNVLSQNPNYAEPDDIPDYTHARLAGLLSADALEDDPPNKPPRARSHPFARSFGRTDAELERPPVDPDMPSRYTNPADLLHSNLHDPLGDPSQNVKGRRLDFSQTSAFTGEDERFAYKRAQSRLWEMCGAKWWARQEEGWHRPLPIEVRRWEKSDQGSKSLSQRLDVGRKGDVRFGGAIEDKSRDERSFRLPGSPNALPTQAQANEDGSAHVGIPKSRPGTAQNSTSSEPHATNSGDASSSVSEGIYSPFRTASEPPPKFNWTHFWGTSIWGKRAGAWGKGPEGLKDRQKE